MDNDSLSNLPPKTRQRIQGTFPASTEIPHPHTTNSQVWAHWEYSADEWALFDQIDWQAAWRRFWLPNIIGAITYLLVMAILALLFLSSTPGILLAPGIFLPLILVIIYGLRTYPYSEAQTRHQARQRQEQPHTVTFSKDGVWEAGTYFPLNDDIMLKLRKVKLTSQPTILHFRLRLAHIRQASEYDTLRVLVPSGRQEEAAHLIQRYHTEVIDAKKKSYNPPEPV